MTKTKKTTHIVSLALFAVITFAGASFADSFVNSGTMNALKDFQFGQAALTSDRADNTAALSRQGDSFVSDAAAEALKDFQFGIVDRPRHTASANTQGLFDRGDSFVSADILNELESVRTMSLTRL